MLSNVLPRDVVTMYEAFVSGDTDFAAAEQIRLLPLIHALFSHVNPVPVKCVMAAMGLCREEYRLPLCPLSEEERAVLLGEARRFI